MRKSTTQVLEKNQKHIYLLIDPRDDQPKYVGCSGKDLRRRLAQHLVDNCGQRRKEWIDSLRLNGLLPKIESIDTVDASEWHFWEKHYISLFRSWGFDLTNMTVGGVGVSGLRMPEDTVAAMRKRLTGRVGSRRGCTHTEEVKAIIREKRKLQTFTKESIDKRRKTVIESGLYAKKVYQYNLDGSFVKEWRSVAEVRRTLGFAPDRYCRGSANGVFKGFVWKYKNENT